jgi:hypothetical protein
MAYKIMQKGEDGVLREVVIRGEAVRGADFNPGDMELKDFDDGTRSFTATGSTGKPDRVEDIIDQKGWILDNFLKNPVGMWAHNYSMLPIFMITDVEVKPRAKKLVFRANFDDYEFADNVYNSYKKKFMRAFSVGFLPLEYEERDRDEMTEEENQRAGWWGGMNYIKQELLEISAVPIPMHPEALADIKRMGLPTEFDFSGGGPRLTLGRSTMSDGSIWIPIDDVNSFVDTACVKLPNTYVKVVSGKPIGKVDSLIIDGVVGYIFPKDADDKGMIKWLVGNAVSEEKATALVTLDLDKYLELTIEEDGRFGLHAKGKPEPSVSSLSSDVDDNIVKSKLDKVRDTFIIFPEGIKIENGELCITTNVGSFTIGSDILEKAGLEMREDGLVDVKNRDNLDIAVNTLTALLKDVKIEPVPEPIVAQQGDKGKEDLTLLLTVAEELQTDIREAIDINPEIFKSAFKEVFEESIGRLIKSSLTKSLKYATGNVE